MSALIHSTRAVLLAATLFASTPWSTAAAQADPVLSARTDSIFATWDKSDSPGCVCAVMRDGSIVHERGYGMANLELDAAIGSESVFYIGSTSKQFTAASIALLALRGDLSLDEDIRTYLPEMQDFGEPVTVRHLIHHTSGIRDYYGLLGLTGWTDRDYFNNDRVYELLARQRTLNFPPGDQELYSNSNYVLLAEIVRRVSGESLARFAAENIFEPLGMNATRFGDDYRTVVKHRAASYAPGLGGYRRYLVQFDGYGAGGLLTTVGDLAKWDENFYDPTVGGPELLSLIHQRGTLNDGSDLDYAFGLAHGEYRGLRTVDHGGAFKGFRAQLLRFPDQHFSVAVLCNLATLNPASLALRVADVYLEDELQPATATASFEAPPTIDVPEAELEQFTDRYWNPNLRAVRRIYVKDGSLMYDRGSGSESPLGAVGDGEFVMLGVGVDVRVSFEPAVGDSPKRMTVVVGGGEPVVARAFEPWTPTKDELESYAGRYYSDELQTEHTISLDPQRSRLLVRVKHQGPAPLSPVMKDVFIVRAVSSMTFMRNAQGEIEAYDIDAGRMRHVRFTRTAGDS